MEITIEQKRAEAEAMAKMAKAKAVAGGSGSLPSALNNSMAAAQTGAMQGMTFGFGDEINAGMMTPIEMAIDAFQGKGFDPGRSYNQALEKSRGYDQATQAADPTAATVGQIAGGIGTGLGLSGAGLTLMKGAAPTVLSMGGRGVLEGAAYGALHGLGNGKDTPDRINQAAWGAGIGGLTGGVMGGAAGALANKSAQSAVPTVEELKAQAGQLYEAAKAKGYVFPQSSVKQVADDIAATAISEGIDQTLHPGATAALKRLQESGANGMTVDNAQTMRRILAAAAKDPTNPDQSRIASIMIDKFDDFLAQSGPELAAARGLYAQAKRGELIEQAIELAGSRAGQFSGSGFENALRTEFRNLDRQIIKGQLKGFSDAEIDAIRQVARGGPIENALRYVGKLAPTGVVSMGAGFGVPFAVGNAVGGPGVGTIAGLGAMGTGLASRQAATAMTMNNARLAAALGRNGGASLAANPTISRVAQALVAAEGSQAPKVPAAISRMLALD